MLEKQPHLCLVDDEPETLAAMRLALRIAGIERIDCCPDWVTARRQLATGLPDLLLLDILMPGVSGIEALRECRSTFPDLPVVMATGVNEIESAVTCMKLGAADYLVKPVSTTRLVECVRSVLLVAEMAQDNPREAGETATAGETPPTATERIVSLAELLNKARLDRVEAPEEFTVLHRQFREVMEKDLAYRNPTVDLAGLAKRLGTNSGTLSRYVNRVHGIPFRTLVNLLRIADFVQLARDPDSACFSLDGIGATVGFARKASFYEAFRALVGMSPGHWLRMSAVPH